MGTRLLIVKGWKEEGVRWGCEKEQRGHPRSEDQILVSVPEGETGYGPPEGRTIKEGEKKRRGGGGRMTRGYPITYDSLISET